jgi:ComF family protein
MARVLPQLARLRGTALDFLFPQWCIGCGVSGSFICQSCLRSLPRIVPPLCPLCGKPQSSGVLCPGCVNWKAEIDGIRSPFKFDGIARQAVYQLKYRNLRALAKPLAQLMFDYLVTSPVPGQILVPVPLHSKRLRERGYNQSGLLAKELGRLLQLPVVDDCLVRERHALPQARTSSVEQRRSNVAGVFTCRDNRFQDKQVLLIDDVSTSGATLDSCAAALKAAGALSVWGLVFSREI